MLRRVNKLFATHKIINTKPPEDKASRAAFLQLVLFITVVVSFAFPILLQIIDPRDRSMLNVLFAGTGIASLVLWFLVRRGHSELASLLLCLGLWLAFTGPILVFEGLHDAAVTGYFFVIVLASLLATGRVVILFTFLSATVLTGVFFAEQTGALIPTVDMPSTPVSLIFLLLLLSVSAFLLRLANWRTTEAHARARQNQVELVRTNGKLATSQAELTARTQALEASTVELASRRTELEQANRTLTMTLHNSQKRVELLQASARVSHAVSQIRDVNTLLSQVTQLISQHFGFYHAGIFLVDESGDYAVLRATNSDGGQRMLARQHRLAVGAQGGVGFVTGTGQSRIASDVGSDATFFDNPDLPETRSEMTLPLRVGDRIIGALDVQSTEPAAFGQEDVALLSILADQVAIAIENAQLFEQAQQALSEAQGAYRSYLRQEWDAFLGKRRPAPTAGPAREHAQPVSRLDELADDESGATRTRRIKP
jgi:putative methionine-R-sulfoxide reductase with GAF domain